MNDVSEKVRPHRKMEAQEQAEVPAEAAAPPLVATQSLELKGQEVELPVRFAAGFVCDSHTAKILETACRRQFKNNMEANIKARAERLSKAETEADRAANQPYTAAEIANLWAEYLPAVGDTPRMGSAERLAYEAGWNAMVALVTEHNAAVAAGKPGIHPAVVGKPINLPSIPAKAKDGESDDDFKHRKAVAEEARRTTVARFAADPRWADRVAAERAKLEAKAGKKPEKAEAADATAIF